MKQITKFLSWYAVSIAAASLALLPNSAQAWGDGGHMIVARLALDHLNPTAKKKAEELLAISIKPASVSARTSNFVQASHWADDVRPLNGFGFSADLHFVDYPFTKDNSLLPDDLPKRENVVKALREYVEVLKGHADDSEKAEALRFIIHFAGDIHQPLHCVSRVSKAHPDGDRGGNDFIIKTRDEEGTRRKTKLHSYWDGGIGTFPRMGAHFEPPPIEEVEAAAASIALENRFEEPEWRQHTTFASWAKESKKLAQEVAYEGINEGQEPTKAYNDAAIKLARQRVAWAGYRLATLLNGIWPET